MSVRWLLAFLHLVALGTGLGAVWARGRALRAELDVRGLRRVFYADNWWGIAALVWLGTGLLRAFGGFEKGTTYYIHNHLFLAKMALFFVILILEVVPMITLVRWRLALRRGERVTPDGARTYAILSFIEAAVVVIMVLLATGMARGVWRAVNAITARITRRLVPFLFLCYIVNYLDRFNIAFAALEMKADLGLSDAVYGLGAGMFFVGYVTFEIPSNLILQRVGARWWIARIMISWGVLSCGMMFVRSPIEFYGLRLLLGIAEAGFLPGMLFYLTHWIPARERAGVFALFLTSTALAGVVGAPLSAGLLGLGGRGGLAGWQWLFLVEGLPAVVLGAVTLRYLPDAPARARWLSADERAWLARVLEAERRSIDAQHLTLFQALTHGRVWRLCLLYFSTIISFYGVAFWLPQIVKSFSGLGNVRASLLSALPYVAASIGMIAVAAHSDRTAERRRHVACCAGVAAAGLAWGALVQSHAVAAFLSLCVAATGIWSTLGPFWSLPTTFLSGTAAAGGIALINSIGNVGGFVGPTVMGFFKQRTHGFSAGLLFLAATLLVAVLLALTLPEERPSPRIEPAAA